MPFSHGVNLTWRCITHEECSEYSIKMFNGNKVLWRICPVRELLKQKPRNALNNRSTSIYCPLLGNKQRKNEVAAVSVATVTMH
jgi:hypothetical protein